MHRCRFRHGRGADTCGSETGTDAGADTGGETGADTCSDETGAVTGGGRYEWLQVSGLK